jgi:DNA-binding IclR family transcriptional regulator
LAWLVDRGIQTAGVREIASALGMAPSSTHHLLTTLEEEGLVRRLEGGRYELGLEFMRLAWRSTARFPVRDLAQPILRDLATASGETALLGLYEPARRQMIFAASADSPQPLRYVIDLNQWVSVHRGASGLAILAFLADDEIEDVIRGLVGTPDDRALDAPALRRELASVRRQGYACTHGQRIDGAVGVAAPAFGADGLVIGDVMVTMPEQRFSSGTEQELAQLVCKAAAELTGALHGPVAGVNARQRGAAETAASSRARSDRVDD